MIWRFGNLEICKIKLGFKCRNLKMVVTNMIKIDHIGMQKQRFSHRLYVALFLCGSKKMNTFVK